MSFDNKVVIVTGASSGIGAATAIQFAAEGAKVCLVGRNQNKLNNVAEKCGKPLVLIADVSNDEDAAKIINDTVKHFGKLDVLVNNAGIANTVSILEKTSVAMDVFDRIIATNVGAPVLLTNIAIPYLVKTKGNIINISSVAALNVISKQRFGYCASKAALDHFTRSVALELAPSGVRVNTVNPGPVYTDFFENKGMTAEQVEANYDLMKKMTALNRVSVADEVADVILFLASDKAKAITGSSYVTDNGVLIKGMVP